MSEWVESIPGLIDIQRILFGGIGTKISENFYFFFSRLSYSTTGKFGRQQAGKKRTYHESF